MEEVDLNLDLSQIDNNYINRVLQLFIDTDDPIYFNRFFDCIIYCLESNIPIRLDVNINNNSQCLINPKREDVSIIDIMILSRENEVQLSENLKMQIANSDRLLTICLREGKYTYLLYRNEDFLFNTKFRDKNLVEYLLENDLIDEEFIKGIINHRNKMAHFCVKHNKTDILTRETTIDGERTTILDWWLKEGEHLDADFNDPVSIHSIIRNNRLDVFANMQNIRNLLTSLNSYETILDLILNSYKRNGRPQLTNIINQIKKLDSMELKAKFYIKFAEHRLEGKLPKLKRDDLFEKKEEDEKCLIDYLLEYNEQLTLRRILSNEVKRDVDVAMRLRIEGIEQSVIDFTSDSREYARAFMEELYSQYDELEISPENEALIAEFKELMMADGKSEEELVNAMARSYRHLIYINPQSGVDELKKIIQIKRNNPDMCIKEVENGCYYRSSESSIYMDDNNIDTLNHEAGHMLYDQLTGKTMPEGFEEVVERVRQSQDVLRRVKEFSIEYRRIRRDVVSQADDRMADYNSGRSSIALQIFFTSTIVKQIELFSDLGYSREELVMLIGESITYDEFLARDKEIKRKELIDSMLRCNHPGIVAISDIIDAIFEGQFCDCALTFEGREIQGSFGHGSEYYGGNLNLEFNEIIANYSSIIKSRHGPEMIIYLRSIVGDEFVDFIAHYYESELVHSTRFSEERSDEIREVGYER